MTMMMEKFGHLAARSSGNGVHMHCGSKTRAIFIATLYNRAGHYIFALWFLFSFFFFLFFLA